MRYCLDTNSAIYFLADRLSEPLPEGEWLISVMVATADAAQAILITNDNQLVRRPGNAILAASTGSTHANHRRTSSGTCDSVCRIIQVSWKETTHRGHSVGLGA